MVDKKIKLSQVKEIDAEAGTVDFVLTSRTIDRDGEVVEPAGVDLANFKQNPVFMWAHSRKDPPIGKVLTDTINFNDSELSAKVQFDLKDPFAAMIFEKYKDGFLNAGSIGFIPKKTAKAVLPGQRGATFTEIELLEFSGVPIPSNPQALAKDFDGDFNGNWKELINEFYQSEIFEHTPEGWVDYVKCVACIEDDDDIDLEIKTPLQAMTPSTLEGSFEWIRSRLEEQAADFLVEHNDKVGFRIENDRAVIVALFPNKSAIVAIVGNDRPWDQDLLVNAEWRMSRNVPQWKGEPSLVEMSVQLVERILQDRGYEKDYDKRVVTYTPTVAALETRAWDGAAARRRLRQWASRDGSGAPDTINWTKYQRGFTWFDAENRSTFGAYKLPHHDIIDEDLSVVWRGVSAAMAALLGARGGADIPDNEQRGVYNHLKRHYAQFDRQPPEFREFNDYESVVKTMTSLLHAGFDMEESDRKDLYDYLCSQYEKYSKEPPEFVTLENRIDEKQEALEAVYTEDDLILETVKQLMKGASNDRKGTSGTG